MTKRRGHTVQGMVLWALTKGCGAGQFHEGEGRNFRPVHEIMRRTYSQARPQSQSTCNNDMGFTESGSRRPDKQQRDGRTILRKSKKPV